jgi:large conductance mechanosensitive channel
MAYSQARGFLSDFGDFIMKGNVLDLAVAVVIGGAFGKIVESLIGDVITPALLKPALEAANVEDLAKLSANGILYGKFIAAVINFLVIAFVIFLIVKSFEAAKRKMARQEALAETPADPAAVAQQELVSAMNRLSNAVESRGGL